MKKAYDIVLPAIITNLLYFYLAAVKQMVVQSTGIPKVTGSCTVAPGTERNFLEKRVTRKA